MKKLTVLLWSFALANAAWAALPVPVPPPIEAIFAAFDATPSLDPAPLPGPIGPTPCTLPGATQETIAALASDTFYTLFQRQTIALAVVNGWQKNLPPGKVQDAMNTVAQQLVKMDPQGTTSFREFIWYRLEGDPAHPVNTAVDGLVAAGFAFPLLVRPTEANGYYPATERFAFLIDFRVAHTGPYTGGFGNLTYREFFNTPATPEAFGAVQIDQFINPGQRYGVLPVLDFQCPDQTEEDASRQGTSALRAGNSKCCCNDPTHTADYRKCMTGVAGNNCTTCGSNCCLLASLCDAHTH